MYNVQRTKNNDEENNPIFNSRHGYDGLRRLTKEFGQPAGTGFDSNAHNG
jgi:hypothetical protein